MKVRDIMTTEVTTATPDTTLEEIATMMRDENVGSIPIVDDEELTGIVTDRDIVVRCIAEGKDPTETTAEEISSEEPQTVTPDTDVREAADIMGRRQIRRLPVVEDNELVGIVALGDIAVKEHDDRESAEALEEISEGVRGGRGRKGAASVGRDRGERAGARGRDLDEEEEVEMPRGRRGGKTGSTRLMGTSEETASRGQVRSFEGAGPARSTKDRKQDQRTARGEAGSARGMRAGSAPSGREGQLAGTRGTGRTGQPGGRGNQGITNRAASRESERQRRVAPKRAQAERGRSKSRRRAS